MVETVDFTGIRSSKLVEGNQLTCRGLSSTAIQNILEYLAIENLNALIEHVDFRIVFHCYEFGLTCRFSIDVRSFDSVGAVAAACEKPMLQTSEFCVWAIIVYIEHWLLPRFHRLKGVYVLNMALVPFTCMALYAKRSLQQF